MIILPPTFTEHKRIEHSSRHALSITSLQQGFETQAFLHGWVLAAVTR